MGLQSPCATAFNLPDGRVVTLWTGKLGTQADGSAVVRCETPYFLRVLFQQKNLGKISLVFHSL